VESIGKLSGEVPYTAFYTRKSYLNNNKEILQKFTKAINKGLAFVKDNDSEVIANVILNQFPDSSLNDIIIIINRYKSYDSWLSNPYISEESFNNLLAILNDNDLIKGDIIYRDLINNLYEDPKSK